MPEIFGLGFVVALIALFPLSILIGTLIGYGIAKIYLKVKNKQ